jgi:NAD(P)-dependent dehydrogenase (short-subunit alcohol dehydrogenase family)
MADAGCVVVVGGTSGIGLELARYYVGRGRRVVVTGRTAEHAAKAAAELGAGAVGIGMELTRPEGIAEALAGVGPVAHLALVAIDRDANAVPDYRISSARDLVTLKLVSFVEIVHTLLGRMSADSSVVVFGGQAKDLPYPGSVTVSTVNFGVSGMVNALAVEIAPIRVNAIHPGFVGDSPYWSDKPQALETMRTRTPTGRLATMADIVHATVFLFENPAVNAANLPVNGGVLLR